MTLTRQDDLFQDGNQKFDVEFGPTVSGDSDYQNKTSLNAPTLAALTLLNVDNDTAGILFDGWTRTYSPLNTTSENAGRVIIPGLGIAAPLSQAAFTVKLQSKPRPGKVVVFDLSIDKSGEAQIAGSTRLTLNDTNWTGVSVDVNGRNDDFADGDQVFTVTATVDAAATTADEFDSLAPTQLSGTNHDNDSAGIVVSTTSLITYERNPKIPTDSFTVKLMSKPIADVGIALTLPVGGTEVTLSTATLNFTTTTWNVEQTVTVTGVDDTIVDGDKPYTIRLTPTSGPAPGGDPKYDAPRGAAFKDVQGINVDNEKPGVSLTVSGNSNINDGESSEISVVLTAKPGPSVTVRVDLAVDKSTLGTLVSTFVTFTDANWDTVQKVVFNSITDAGPCLDTTGFTGTISTPDPSPASPYDTLTTVTSPTIIDINNSDACFIDFVPK